MDAKKLTITLIITLALLPIGIALAGQTTITGTASCVMPDLFEFNSPAVAAAASTIPTARTQADLAPIPSGASGNYEVQKEEKLIQTEEIKKQNEAKAQGEPITVYTVCAK